MFWKPDSVRQGCVASRILWRLHKERNRERLSITHEVAKLTQRQFYAQLYSIEFEAFGVNVSAVWSIRMPLPLSAAFHFVHLCLLRLQSTLWPLLPGAYINTKKAHMDALWLYGYTGQYFKLTVWYLQYGWHSQSVYGKIVIHMIGVYLH